MSIEKDTMIVTPKIEGEVSNMVEFGSQTLKKYMLMHPNSTTNNPHRNPIAHAKLFFNRKDGVRALFIFIKARHLIREPGLSPPRVRSDKKRACRLQR